MKRYVAFLRGVSPMNCKMPELKRAYERAGFKEVETLLASGNVVFSAKPAAVSTIERACEAAAEKYLKRSFDTIVRPVDDLRAMLEADPYTAFELKPRSKRVVTFLRKKPKVAPELPIEMHDARILLVQGNAVFSAYSPGPKGPVFMALIEKTFGKELTTRTWDTVQKCAK